MHDDNDELFEFYSTLSPKDKIYFVYYLLQGLIIHSDDKNIDIESEINEYMEDDYEDDYEDEMEDEFDYEEGIPATNNHDPRNILFVEFDTEEDLRNYLYNFYHLRGFIIETRKVVENGEKEYLHKVSVKVLGETFHDICYN